MDIVPLLTDLSLLVDSRLIGGEWPRSGSGSIEVNNLASGPVIARVPNAGTEETCRAIEAAKAALSAWRAMTAAKRSA
jgi:succinate-semialdehyde dehydrogenase/glutarate-semialdehyde dehydrogenase